MRDIRLLKRGLFETKLMDSRIKSNTVTTSEKIIGHMIGHPGPGDACQYHCSAG